MRAYSYPQANRFVDREQAVSFFFGANHTTLCRERLWRFLAATRIALMSKPCLAAKASRTRRTSSTTGSFAISLTTRYLNGVGSRLRRRKPRNRRRKDMTRWQMHSSESVFVSIWRGGNVEDIVINHDALFDD